MGKRGGGSVFTQEIVELLEQDNHEITAVISSRNSTLSTIFQQMNASQISIVEIKKPYLRLDLIYRLVKNFKTEGGSISLNTMISHRDYSFWLVLKVFKIQRWQVIHDHKHHKGDNYPLNVEVSYRLRSADRLLVLSENIKFQLASRGYESTLIFDYKYMLRDRRAKSSNYGLIIGRQQEYQGVARIKNILPEVSNNGIYWIVAGENQSTDEDLGPRSLRINRWLEDFQVRQLISNAKFVLLPYLEASQSGVLKIAQEAGVFVIIPPVDGLVEFVSHGMNGFISAENADESLIKAITEVINFQLGTSPKTYFLATQLSKFFILSKD
jgi:glycosyltransferase involved in cell wall biosynthesis